MNILTYILFFIIGITFGSFFTLATYRIPLNQDITHTRSYCPNCGHKLSFWDMIPLFSYIFLGGKCRYCKNKIKIRYFLFEIFSGIVFVLFAVSVNFDVLNVSLDKIIYCVVGVLYLAGLFIIAGIDKENHYIDKRVLIYVIFIETLYIIYLYIVEKANIYRYVIYLFLLVILSVINNFYYHKKLKNNYTLDILTLIAIMSIFTKEYAIALSITLTLLSIGLFCILKALNSKKNKCVKSDKKEETVIPIGYFLCVSNIIMYLFLNYITFYRG